MFRVQRETDMSDASSRTDKSGGGAVCWQLVLTWLQAGQLCVGSREVQPLPVVSVASLGLTVSGGPPDLSREPPTPNLGFGGSRLFTNLVLFVGLIFVHLRIFSWLHPQCGGYSSLISSRKKAQELEGGEGHPPQPGQAGSRRFSVFSSTGHEPGSVGSGAGEPFT